MKLKGLGMRLYIHCRCIALCLFEASPRCNLDIPTDEDLRQSNNTLSMTVSKLTSYKLLGAVEMSTHS